MRRHTKTLIWTPLVIASLLVIVFIVYQDERSKPEDTPVMKLAPIISGINEQDSLLEVPVPDTSLIRGATPPLTLIPREDWEKMPNLQFFDEVDQPVQLSDFRGQIVVLNFWASWCPACTDEMPEFEAFYHKHIDDPGVTLLSINLTYGRETREAADRYLSSNSFSFPIYFDPTGEAFEPFGLSSIPKTVYIGPEGEAGFIIHHRTDLEELDYHLDAMYKLLGIHPTESPPTQ